MMALSIARSTDLDANYEFKDGSHNAQPVTGNADPRLTNLIDRIFTKSAESSYATITGRVVESKKQGDRQKKADPLGRAMGRF